MREKLEAYFASIKSRIDDIQAVRNEIELREAPRFSVFDYIYTDENKLSNIISDLLDPNGKHGQGYTFLVEFFKLIKLDDKIGHNSVRIIREASTRLINSTRRRMDILIDFSNYAVMIENKPWAIDQINQLADYKEHLNREYNGRFVIVYLTTTGRKPSKNSLVKKELDELIDSGKFIQLSFDKDLIAWLERCIKECNPQNVKQFLKEFKFYLLNNFNTKLHDTGTTSDC